MHQVLHHAPWHGYYRLWAFNAAHVGAGWSMPEVHKRTLAGGAKAERANAWPAVQPSTRQPGTPPMPSTVSATALLTTSMNKFMLSVTYTPVPSYCTCTPALV